MTEMTPGRGAYEAWWAKYIELDSDDPANDTPPPWFDQADDYCAAWEAAAQAAIKAWQADNAAAILAEPDAAYGLWMKTSPTGRRSRE